MQILGDDRRGERPVREGGEIPTGCITHSPIDDPTENQMYIGVLTIDGIPTHVKDYGETFATAKANRRDGAPEVTCWSPDNTTVGNSGASHSRCTNKKKKLNPTKEPRMANLIHLPSPIFDTISEILGVAATIHRELEPDTRETIKHINPTSSRSFNIIVERPNETIRHAIINVSTVQDEPLVILKQSPRSIENCFHLGGGVTTSMHHPERTEDIAEFVRKRIEAFHDGEDIHPDGSGKTTPLYH